MQGTQIRSYLPLTLVFVACVGGDPEGATNTAPGPDAAATGAVEATGANSPTDATGTMEPTTGTPQEEADELTYYQDAAPILSERCGGCHVAGGPAPFALTTYEEVAPFAPLIRASIAAGDMPPWPPGPATPAIQHDRRLTPAELDLLLRWIDGGAPAGDAADPAPPRPPEVVELPQVDLAVDIGTDYVPDAMLADDYHCFMIDLGVTEDRMATGYRFIPGNTRTVHHVTNNLFTAGSRAALEARDAETPDSVGWPCFGGIDDIEGATVVGGFGAWVPGVSAVNYPAGFGKSVPAGAILVAQIHYNLGGGTDPDRTGLELALASPEQQASIEPLRGLRLAKLKLDIPAGEKEVIATTTRPVGTWMQKPFSDGKGFVLGASGHMHMLGTKFTVELQSASGTQTVLDIPRWDFHWQGSYLYVTPIPIDTDDLLTIRCIYDNSAEHRAAQGMGPPVDVQWGEGTLDEMCLGNLMVVDTLP